MLKAVTLCALLIAGPISAQQGEDGVALMQTEHPHKHPHKLTHKHTHKHTGEGHTHTHTHRHTHTHSQVSEKVLSLKAGQASDGVNQNKCGKSFNFDPAGNSMNFFSGWFAGWEKETYDIFNYFIGPDTVVLDVGAWIGPTALYEAQIAKRVVALEPTEEAFRKLELNLAANAGAAWANRLTIARKALGDHDAHSTITNGGASTDQITDAASGAPNGTAHDANVQTVPVDIVSIATLVASYPELGNTTFVKIDTEGYEEHIVPALLQFFAQKRANVFVSLHDQFIGPEKAQAVVAELNRTFPHLYRTDLSTPYSPVFTGDGDGIVATWEPIDGDRLAALSKCLD